MLKKEHPKNRINRNLGLNQPFIKRYTLWFLEILHGNLGNSYKTGEPVRKILRHKGLQTLRLFGTAFLLTLILSVLLGSISSLSFDKKRSQIYSHFCIFLHCIPPMLTGIFLIYIFGIQLKLLPASGSNSIFENNWQSKFLHLILPVTTVVLSHLGSFSRILQDEMLKNLNKPFVQVAQANRVEKKYIYWNVLKNSLIPFLNYTASHLPSFFCGLVVVETIFSYPGLGDLLIQSIQIKNFPVIMGLILLIGFLVIISMILVHFIELLLNPKLRRGVCK